MNDFKRREEKYASEIRDVSPDLSNTKHVISEMLWDSDL